MGEAAVTQLWMLGVVGIMVAFGVLTAIGALRHKAGKTTVYSDK